MTTELVKELRSIETEKKNEPNQMEYHPYKDETEMRLMIYNFEILLMVSTVILYKIYCPIKKWESGKVSFFFSLDLARVWIS